MIHVLIPEKQNFAKNGGIFKFFSRLLLAFLNPDHPLLFGGVKDIKISILRNIFLPRLYFRHVLLHVFLILEVHWVKETFFLPPYMILFNFFIDK
jgi:hypothetical protein